MHRGTVSSTIDGMHQNATKGGLSFGRILLSYQLKGTDFLLVIAPIRGYRAVEKGAFEADGKDGS